jgi:superfamily II DNA or RNA helicase
LPREFPQIQFKSELRPSQVDAIEIARQQLAEGKKRLHIVAPPGSGKTVMGLYLWALCIRRPAVVFSPNSAIQMQWAARTDLFEVDGGLPLESFTSTDPKQLNLFNSLTYQSVTLPRRRGEDLEETARELWIEKLIDKDQATNPAEAEAWIEDLAVRNPEYYENRFSGYRKKVRDWMATSGDAIETLHQSAIKNLEGLRDKEVGLVILDECHHLMGHWGRVLADAQDLLEGPIIIGLTATPPDRKGKSSLDISRYDNFFGPIDYQVPLPAVVKDGYLAPYQDLVYFVRPTSEELSYIANADEALTELVEELCKPADIPIEKDAPPPVIPLPDWIEKVLAEFRLGTTTVSSWFEFERRDPVFAEQGPLFLKAIGRTLMPHVPDLPLPVDWNVPGIPDDIETLSPVLDRYIRHGLRRSEQPADHERAVKAIRVLRSLGVQVTETGTQACASPMSRVMAYSKSKAEALVPILTEEQRVLGEGIRAVVITDYEKTSAVIDEIRHLLDEESGGAIAAFKQLLTDEVTDRLDPVLVTGSTVLVDDDLVEKFLAASRQWLEEHGGDVELTTEEHEGFSLVRGKGSNWSPRLYVRMITELFQQGVTRCLVGTRGLLGEGWDASRINVLLDLTAVTTTMTVNQLRGRSIRLDSHAPEKLADNWDVICLAPEFRKGLDDYARFAKKHNATYGVCEDGAIEKGPGHVHAAFTRLKPENVEGAATAINDEMLKRVSRRAEARIQWGIGEPYQGKPVQATECGGMDKTGGFPPFSKDRIPWSNRSLATAIGEAVLVSLDELGLIANTGVNSVKSRQPWRMKESPLTVRERAGGYVRIFLEDADKESAEIFNQALREVLGPIENPRYVIPRHIDVAHHNLLSRLLPGALGRFFIRYEQNLAMLHSVPSVLARNKNNVAVFEKYWNEYVSPGSAVFALREEGKQLLADARQNGQLPQTSVHGKEIYLPGEKGSTSRKPSWALPVREETRVEPARPETVGEQPPVPEPVGQPPSAPEPVGEHPPRSDPPVPEPITARSLDLQPANLTSAPAEMSGLFTEQIQRIGYRCFPADTESQWEVVNVEEREGVYWVEATATPDVGYSRIKFVMGGAGAGNVIAGYCLEESGWSLLFTAPSGYEHVPTIVADLEGS